MNKRTRMLFFGISILFIASFLGSGFAVYRLKSVATSKGFMLENGCWRVNPIMDLNNRYQRAIISVVGLFALRESEVLYFVAREDSDGNPLLAEHTYQLEGSAPDARYWSYTLYGADYFLVSNATNTYGFNMDNIQYLDTDEDNPELPDNVKGNHQIIIASTTQEGNWLPSGSTGPFCITLRMYNPAPAVYQNLESISLPRIKRVD